MENYVPQKVKRAHNFVLPLKVNSNFIPRMLYSNIYSIYYFYLA